MQTQSFAERTQSPPTYDLKDNDYAMGMLDDFRIIGLFCFDEKRSKEEIFALTAKLRMINQHYDDYAHETPVVYLGPDGGKEQVTLKEPEEWRITHGDRSLLGNLQAFCYASGQDEKGQHVFGCFYIPAQAIEGLIRDATEQTIKLQDYQAVVMAWDGSYYTQDVIDYLSDLLKIERHTLTIRQVGKQTDNKQR